MSYKFLFLFNLNEEWEPSYPNWGSRNVLFFFFWESLTDKSLNSKDCISVKPSHELSFAHSTTNYSSELKLFNKKDQPVIFKVNIEFCWSVPQLFYQIRTTAAKSYVVVPTAGQILPGDSTIVKIYMLPRVNFKICFENNNLWRKAFEIVLTISSWSKPLSVVTKI